MSGSKLQPNNYEKICKLWVSATPPLKAKQEEPQLCQFKSHAPKNNHNNESGWNLTTPFLLETKPINIGTLEQLHWWPYDWN
jgi:hypothetical protein